MGKKKNKQTAPGELMVCRNPKATREYEIEERLECGLVLTGSEVKSLRAKHADLEGAYASVDRDELYLHKMHIGPYEQAGHFGHETKRSRKLLAHRHQIQRLMGKLATRGYTLVPIQVYFKNGRAKVELGLARGRKQGDRRETLRREADLREARAAMDRGRR
ncbi:MAG: SsrA-binding protein SmpB [Myxococcales bacterium]|nr:SsrA-binding protein SmpB [Myxococcales bacterium]